MTTPWLTIIGIGEEGRLSIFERTFNRCMGMTASGNSLYASTLWQLWRFENALGDGEMVMLKLTLPEKDGLYADCVSHPNVARVVALSGGYSREEANDRLGRQNGMVASFSRALAEGLH